MLVALGLTNFAFSQAPALVDVGGLLQRITISIGFAWLTALAVHTLAAIPTEYPPSTTCRSARRHSIGRVDRAVPVCDDLTGLREDCTWSTGCWATAG